MENCNYILFSILAWMLVLKAFHLKLIKLSISIKIPFYYYYVLKTKHPQHVEKDVAFSNVMKLA